jgi:hypothetical protein
VLPAELNIPTPDMDTLEAEGAFQDRVADCPACTVAKLVLNVGGTLGVTVIAVEEVTVLPELPVAVNI